MQSKDIGTLILLSALWGASFLFVRIAAPVLGPFITIALRVIVAAAALLLYAVLMRRPLSIRRHWKSFLVMGALNAAIPFTLIAAALVNLNASVGSILNASTTFFTALVAAIWLKEPLTKFKLLGIALGMMGVTVLVDWAPVPLNTTTALSILAVLTATLSYGIAGVYAKTVSKGIAAFDFAAGQQIGASVLIVPFALVSLPTAHAPSLVVVLAVCGVALFSTAAAYLLYYRLIANVGPTGALSATFLIPAFGILWGRLFLDELIRFNMLVGLSLILLGMIFMLQVRPKFNWVTRAKPEVAQ
jgi:drug/metabolite transporter (DMT)-like permease